MLPVGDRTDYITRPSPLRFDPSNTGYSCVLGREAPNLQSKMGWAFPPNEETCGDCIEGLLAIADEQPRLQFGSVTIGSGARFFREQAYACWRIHRVLKWDRATTKTMNIALGAFFLGTKCAVNKRCRCNLCSIPHPWTMQCSRCGIESCGLLICLHSNGLLCRPCKVHSP